MLASSSWYFIWKQWFSSSFFFSSCSRTLASSSLNFSASATILSISSLERRPPSLVMVIFSTLPQVKGEGEVLTFSESLALNDGLMGGGESSLGLLALGAETTESAVVSLDRDTTRLLGEFFHAELDESVVEIFTTEMGVTVSGLDLEDAILNGEEGHIEGTTTEIEDEDVAQLAVLFVETVGNGGGGGLVDDSLHVHAGDGTSILGGLTLGIVEVGGYGDDSISTFLSEVSLGDFLHLGEDHGRDL